MRPADVQAWRFISDAVLRDVLRNWHPDMTCTPLPPLPSRRREEVISDAVLRDMLRNWHPDMARTSTGYLKNVSVLQRVDPFTLEVSGTAVRNGAPAEAAAAGGGGGGGGGEQPAGKQASAEPAPVLQRPAA
eukprot:359139-Chlamydomonas_euryale.AAC.14